jgi:hypothetical protein
MRPLKEHASKRFRRRSLTDTNNTSLRNQRNELPAAATRRALWSRPNSKRALGSERNGSGDRWTTMDDD